MGSFCSGNQNTTTRTSQQQDTNQQAQNEVSGTSGGTTTPYLQWLSSEAANMGAPFGTMGNPWIAASAAPVTAGNIESLAYPLAGQEFQTAYGAMLPSIQDQTKAIEEANSTNPDASSTAGALERYYGTVNANLANLAQGLTAGAYNAGIPVAEANQAALARAGMGINTGNLGWLGTIPGLVQTAGQTFANQFGQKGTSESQGQTTGTGTSTSNTSWTPSYMSMLGSLFSAPSLFGGGGGGGGAAAGAGSFGGDVMSGIGNGLSWLGGLFAADGGPIRDGYALGGEVGKDDRTARFADEVRRHFHAFHALRKHAESGGREHHADTPGAVTGDGGDGGWSAGTDVTGPGAKGSDQADDLAADAADDQAASGNSWGKTLKDAGAGDKPRPVPEAKWLSPPQHNLGRDLAGEMANAFARAPRNAMGAPRYDIGGEIVSAEGINPGLGTPAVSSAENSLKAVDTPEEPDLTKVPAYKLALLAAMEPWRRSGSTPLTAAHGGRVGFQDGDRVTPATTAVALPVPPASTGDDGTSPDDGYNAASAYVKNAEGFDSRSKADFGQYSSGWGTKEPAGAGIPISREEAQRRFDNEFRPTYDSVKVRFPNANQAQLNALSSLTHNVGPGWMKDSELAKAVDAGDWDAAAHHILSYNHAGGQERDFLTRRRMTDAAMLSGHPVQAGRGESAGYYPQNSQYVNSGQAARDMMKRYDRDPWREWFAAFGENSGIPGVPGMTHGQLANLQNRSDFLLKQQEAAGSLFSPEGGYAPTLEAQKAAGMVNINGQTYPTAQSIEGQRQIAAYKAPLERDLAMFPYLLQEYNKISSDEAWGVMSPEQANARRTMVWRNYEQLKQGIHATPGTPSAAPAPPVKPNQPQPTQKMSDEYIARQKNNARAEIEKGKDRGKILQRLNDMGITDTTGL